MSFGHIQHSLLRAACAGGDQGEVHGHPADGPEQAPAPVPLPELQRRAGIQFSGDSGAVVASGGEGVTSAPTYQLVKDVIEVVADLPPALFDGVRRPPRRGGAKVVVCRLCDILTDLRVRSPAATVPAGRVDQCTIRDSQGAMQRCARPLRTHALIRTSVGAAC